MIELNNICKSFGEHIIFENYSLTIDNGEFVVITGNSGCGKTTLMNIMSSLEPVDSGEITVNGIDITKRKNQLKFLRDNVGFLFQNYGLIDNKTVAENLKIIGTKSRSDISMENALQAVGLADKMEQYIYTLSGGEQQRVALARLMYKKCSIIFADEPTGSLDKGNAVQVMEILKSLNNQGKTVIMVTHDSSLVSYGTKIIELGKN
ncbi:MAG: ABC transporter ATP-binding protein [Ruminococcus sp.]|nr:ABC transporter ATP-binding protein [Ruminococcus sp.]